MFMDFDHRPLKATIAFLIGLYCGNPGAETLKVRADHWYPLNGEPDSPKPGFAIEILQAIYPPRGIELDYQLADWSRSLDMARDGRIDCVVGAYRSEAPDLRYPETPLAWDIAAFYVSRGSGWRYRGLESLEEVSLGLIAGYGYGDVLDEYIEEHRGDSRLRFMHGREPLRRNIKKLVRGRLDVLVESPFVMESLLERMDLVDEIREAGRAGNRTPLYMACSPETRDVDRLLGIFDRGMKELQERGEIARIMERYGVRPSVIRGDPEPRDQPADEGDAS